MKSLLLLLLACLPAQAATSVSLEWNPNTETNLSGYRLYWGVTPRFYPTNLTVKAPATTTTVTGLLAGMTYYFSVTAYLTNGLESPFSDEISYQIPLPPVPPAKPTNLRITGTSNNTASIWVDNPSTHMLVQHSDDMSNWVAWAQLKSMNPHAPVEKAIYLSGVEPEGSRFWRSISLARPPVVVPVAETPLPAGLRLAPVVAAPAVPSVQPLP